MPPTAPALRGIAVAVAGVAIAAAVLGPASPSLAQSNDASALTPPVDLGTGAAPIRFETAPGTTLQLGDGKRYTGAIEARLGADGSLTVVDEVTMDDYVAGVAEMPVSWPLAALEAQAVAARTYGWFEAAQGRWRQYGFDVCASTSCQVFRGREVVERPGGERWQEAVAGTSGVALTYEGKPILARFFSTSGGRTRDNEQVFPNEGPRPYLKAVDDPDDAIAPLHRWTVSFSRAQFDEILARGEQMGPTAPVAAIEHRVDPGPDGDRIRVTGVSGATAEVSTSAFRAFVSDVAASRFPDQYPTRRPDGVRLPTTLPSSRFEVALGPDTVTFEGRGWGHGVGMGQWGARGKAERGLAYPDILSAYYTGLAPSSPEALPATLRVGLSRGGEEVTVAADGPMRVVVGGREITANGYGTWTARAGAGGLELVSPAGYGSPLVVGATATTRPRPSPVEVIRLETTVNKPSQLALQVRDAAGAEVLTRPLAVVAPGVHRVSWDLDDGEGTQVAPGAYTVTLAAMDETGVASGEPVAVEVVPVALAESGLTTLLSDAPPTSPTSRTGLLVAAVLGVLGGGVLGRRIPVGSA